MPVSSLQLKMARAALDWNVRELATKAGISPDTITRAEQGNPDVTQKTWGAIQKALEEAGIEFLPEKNSVTLHPDVKEAAICADPDMPLGVRRIYGFAPIRHEQYGNDPRYIEFYRNEDHRKILEELIGSGGQKRYDQNRPISMNLPSLQSMKLVEEVQGGEPGTYRITEEGHCLLRRL